MTSDEMNKLLDQITVNWKKFKREDSSPSEEETSEWLSKSWRVFFSKLGRLLRAEKEEEKENE